MSNSHRVPLRPLLLSPLLLLATGCAGTHRAPTPQASPRYSVEPLEQPVVEPVSASASAADPLAESKTTPQPATQPTADPGLFALESSEVPPQYFNDYSDVPVRQSWRVNRPPDHNFTFMIGVRDLNNSDWAGVDSIPNIAFTEDSKIPGADFSVDFGMHYAASGNTLVDSTGTQASSEVFEWDLGLLKRFAPGQGIWQPYVGAGVALVRAAGTIPVSPEVPRDYDWSFGLYARAGIALAVSEGGSVGLDFRYLGATDVNLAGISTDVNGGTASLFFGVGF